MNVGKVSHNYIYIILFSWLNPLQENGGSTYRSFMTQHGRVEIDAEGWGTFSCFANYVQVWVKLEQEA